MLGELEKILLGSKAREIFLEKLVRFLLRKKPCRK